MEILTTTLLSNFQETDQLFIVTGVHLIEDTDKCKNNVLLGPRGTELRFQLRFFFLAFFLVRVLLKYASLKCMCLRPGYMSFESKQYGGQRWPELLFWRAGFEWLKHHKVGIFMKKVIRKGLKRARSLLLGIRSLQGNTIFRWLELTSTEDPEKNNW